MLIQDILTLEDMKRRSTPHERDDSREQDTIPDLEWSSRSIRKPREVQRREPNRIRARVEIESDEESLAYLTGAMRDGSVFYDKGSRNYFTMFYQKFRNWLVNSISTRTRKLFQKPGKVEQYKSGHFRLKISSKKLYLMWKQRFGFPEDGKGQGSWNVPQEIKSADPATKASYIRGVFDTEGDVSPHSSKSFYAGISQKNRTFIEEIRGLLKDLDIHPGKTHVIDKKSGTLRIAISEKKSLLRFIKIIKSEHPVKRKDLQRIQSLLEQET